MKTSARTERDGQVDPDTDVPGPPEREAPTPADPSAPAGAPDLPQVPEKVRELLIEFARTLNRHTMYPANHPALRGSSAAVAELATNVLGDGEKIAITVGRNQLAVEGAATDPHNPALASLASQLQEHDVAAVTISRGFEGEELEELFVALSPDPNDLATSPLADAAWPHIQIAFRQYDRLALDASGDGDLASGDASEVWLALAHSALVDDEAGPEGAASADHLAREIEARCTEEEYAHEVTHRLLEVERAIESSPGQSAELRQLASDLLTRLNSDSLRSLLDAGTSSEERRQLLAGASNCLGVGAAMKLMREIAELEHYEIPRPVWIMLTKLARYAESGDREQRLRASKLIRDQVMQLLAGWNPQGHMPADYTKVLETMSAEPSAEPSPASGRSRASVSPSRMLQMGIEVGEARGKVIESFTEMVGEGSVADILTVLDGAPEENPAALELQRRIEDPEILESLIRVEEPDFDVVDRLLPGLGVAAAPPMLDVLADSDSRTKRNQLFRRLADMGPEIAPEVAARVDTDRWYVRRNMLSLLHELNELPDGFTAAPYIEDESEAVRLAAIKILLREPNERNRAIGAALRCGDSRTVITGLIAARDGCSEDLVGAILEFAMDEANTMEVRKHAIRALDGVRNEAALEALLKLARPNRGWFFRRSSKPVPEAQSVLRSTWADAPRAKRLLRRTSRQTERQKSRNR